VTLRLTVFEIFKVKWPNISPKYGILGIPWENRPQSGDFLSGTDMYHHAKFHADLCHRRQDICNCIRKTHIDKRGVAVKTTCNSPSLFKGNVSVADCMLLLIAITKSQLSKRDRAMLHVTEYFAKSLKVIRNDTVQ